MKKFRTVASVIIMVIAGIVGFFIGAFLNEPMAGTILFSNYKVMDKFSPKRTGKRM